MGTFDFLCGKNSCDWLLILVLFLLIGNNNGCCGANTVRDGGCGCGCGC